MRKWVHTTDMTACQSKIDTKALLYRPVDTVRPWFRDKVEVRAIFSNRQPRAQDRQIDDTRPTEGKTN